MTTDLTQTACGDFSNLLQRSGHISTVPKLAAESHGRIPFDIPQATTVLSFHYKDGVIIAGDRRATAGNIVVYDRADKVIEIDRSTIMAIAGTPATAFEMARTLQTSFQYYRRSQLQPLSLEAKVRALGKLLRDNMSLSLQGIGIVIPILAIHDPLETERPRLYFYDVLGAQFQAVDFSASGSGSPAVRSVLNYLNRWSGRPTMTLSEKEAVTVALQLLEVAAESDTATGGIDRRTQIYPQVKLLRADGITTIAPEILTPLLASPA